MSLDLTRSHVFVDGHLVNAKVERLVQAIKDYEPELDVQWIPPNARKEGQAAYAIIHRPKGSPHYVLFYVQNDEEFDERVLAKIIHNDQRNGKQQYSDLETAEMTQKLLAKQEYLDRLEEANDIAAHVLRSPKHKYVVDKDTVIRDYGNRIK